MRRLLAFMLCFTITALLLMVLGSPAALATGWEWRQDDWSGGPGQAAWADDARYNTSINMDTMSVPGTLRITQISNPYTKEPTNPVLGPGAVGTWDAQGVFGLPRRREGGGYEIIYRGSNAAGLYALGYASSGNGIAWTKLATNPVLQRLGTVPWDQNGVEGGPLLVEGQDATMFFVGYDPANARRYGRATSQNLTSWQRGNDPVFGPGAVTAWDANLGACYVQHDGPVYKMWYHASDALGVARVGYASSSDGITWNRSAANPVLGPGPGGSWDEKSIDGYVMLKRPWAGDYLMAYTAHNNLNVVGVGVATSPDGVVWTKLPAAIFTMGAAAWCTNALLTLDLAFDGSFYKLTVLGANATNRVSAGELISPNGVAWGQNAANPVLPFSPGPAWDDFGVWAMAPFLEGNTLRMFYSGISLGSFFRIGTATCTPQYFGGALLDSSVFDVGSTAQWGNVTWKETKPAGTTVNVFVRAGNVPAPDASWTAWAPVLNGAAVPHPASRYIQYRVILTGPPNDTPTLSNLAIDLTALPSTWYFAEGFTGAGFNEWISIENPNAAPAAIQVTYYTPGAAPAVRNHTADPQSRLTINVNTDLGNNLENSFKITSNQPVIVERPMYFRHVTAGGTWEGGHDAMGSTTLSRHWYFAEGYTGQGTSEEWLTIQNPNPGWATLDVTYFVNGAAPIRKQHRAAPTSRYTINVNVDAGPNLEVSTRIDSDQPIIAERPMYFNYMGSMDGGHIVMGSPFLAQDWYLAEGATFSPFTEYVTIQNPNTAPANLIVTYYVKGGTPVTRNHTVQAQRRDTINVGPDSGVSGDISTWVHSDQPVLVERPQYFDMLGGALAGGHCAMGVNSSSTTWYFGEGYTGGGFDEWLTIQNPNAVAATVVVTYYRAAGGVPIVKNHTVDPNTRYTIDVNTDAGEGLAISAFVSSNQPVICERPMYFFYQGPGITNCPGGHDSQGFAP